MIALKLSLDRLPVSCKECCMKMRVEYRVKYDTLTQQGYSVASCIYGVDVSQNIFNETRNENCPLIEIKGDCNETKRT